MSKRADLIITNIGQLITCALGGVPRGAAEMRDVGFLRNAAVPIVDGRFVEIDLPDDLARSFTADITIDAGGRVVCPGFVDPHTHLVYAGDRLDEFELRINGAGYLSSNSSS